MGCSSSQASLLSCSHNGLGVTSCSHSNDAGVVCSTCKLYQEILSGKIFDGKIFTVFVDIVQSVKILPRENLYANIYM